MTAQRLVRGSKARIILSLCGVLCCVGVILLLQNTRAQLDGVSRNYDTCVLQQESLSTQLQVIVDYKTKLEKSLQLEKTEHKHTRTELESRINDEKSQRDKTSMEAKLQLSSLQQHYKLLQAENNDLKEKNGKLQQYFEETDKLQAKVKELQEQLKALEKNKDTAIEHLKNQYLQVKVDKENLQEQLKKSLSTHDDLENKVNHLVKENHQLQHKIDGSKLPKGSSAPLGATIPYVYPTFKPSANNFQKQIEGPTGVYQIKVDGPSSQAQIETAQAQETDQKPNEETIAKPDEKSNQGDYDDTYAQAQSPNKYVLPKPKGPQDELSFYLKPRGPVRKDNSEGNVLQMPEMYDKDVNENNFLARPSNGHNTTRMSSKAISRGSFNAAQPLAQPTVTPATKKIPAGVVPVPNAKSEVKVDDKGIPDEVNLAMPNRYRNNIIEGDIVKERLKETKVEVKPAEEVGDENGAVEVLGPPNDSLHVLDGDNINAMLKKPILPPEGKRKQHIDKLGDRGEEERVGIGGAAYDGGDGDYNKDEQKDLQIDEGEDDDPDDYNMVGKQKDPAIRN